MKRIIALILSLALLLSGCAPAQTQPTQAEETQHVNATTDPTAHQQDEIVWQEVVPEYCALDNSELLCLSRIWFIGKPSARLTAMSISLKMLAPSTFLKNTWKRSLSIRNPIFTSDIL